MLGHGVYQADDRISPLDFWSFSCLANREQGHLSKKCKVAATWASGDYLISEQNFRVGALAYRHL